MAVQALYATAAHLEVCSVLLEELLSLLTRLDSTESSQAGKLSLDSRPITIRPNVTLTEHDLHPRHFQQWYLPFLYYEFMSMTPS